MLLCRWCMLLPAIKTLLVFMPIKKMPVSVNVTLFRVIVPLTFFVVLLFMEECQMCESEKQSKIESALSLSDFFKVEFTLSIFGKTLIHYVYPPLKNH